MEPTAPAGRRAQRLLAAAFALTLFFLVVGAKWTVVDRFGSDIPNWDQWDAEGQHLLIPWFENGDLLHELFLPHNEHRIVLTKLQNLAVVLAAGQWDARIECVVNALLHGAFAAALWLTGCRWLAARWHAPLFLLTAALFALPLAWENTLGGFHSQQYWLLGLSFATIVTLPFAPPWRIGWWAALAAAALAMLSMGSGFLAAAVVLATVGLRVVRGDTALRQAWPVFALTAAFVAVGVLTRVSVDYHERLKAHTAHDFFLYCLHSLQWPLQSRAGLAALLWFPWVAVAWRAVRTRDPREARIAQTIAALGAWVLIQIFATAYARGAGADFPAPRYQDTLGFGMMVNALALGWLLSRAFPAANVSPPPRHRFALAVLGAAWLATLACGLAAATTRVFQYDLPHTKAYYLNAENYTRGYLVTGDPAQLAFEDVPYPTPGLIERLAHPSLRALLPQSVRPPLPLSPASPARGAFVENHASQLHLDTAPRDGLSPATPPLASRPTWGSFGPAGAATIGEWTSAPLTSPRGGWLVFQTAGQIGPPSEAPAKVGGPGVSLELRDARTGARLADIRPTKVPGDQWRAAYVRAPRVPFVVVARDDDPARWIAFSAPVEMSSLSHFAWQLAKNGPLIAELAATAAALLALAALALRPRAPPRPA